MDRREQCILNNRRYRQRMRREMEHLRRMKQYFMQNHSEIYQTFATEDTQAAADTAFQSYTVSVDRREQCILNNRRYRQRMKTELEFLRQMNKYFHERYYEFYQKFIMEDGEDCAGVSEANE